MMALIKRETVIILTGKVMDIVILTIIMRVVIGTVVIAANQQLAMGIIVIMDILGLVKDTFVIV